MLLDEKAKRFLNTINSFLAQSTSEVIAEDKSQAAQMMKFVLDTTENFMLVTSIFSFSHNVNKRLPLQCHYKLGLYGKRLGVYVLCLNLG